MGKQSNYPSPSASLAKVKNDELKEPKNYKEASTNEDWVKAMTEEIETLKENNTWRLVEKPSNINIIGSCWVNKVKSNSDGSVQCLKALLVAQGYNQHKGDDFTYRYILVV